ncbi:hypothetical protein CgunFtcFv8_015400 [Champsocephalus gunnari]|uniref:Ig-like domain-containing protein n=1 Tax=Champsocephalus gunnari TaxID=52237 RepID=A0AAN8C5W1_CHAGU|nr:hypothetical protein CgunFtcFv8_015400 [Champsocephalus gunnari]
MSATHTWACFLLCLSFASPDKTPDIIVTCSVSGECVLPCSFPPGSEETIEWFKQEVVVYKFEREEKDDNDSSEEEHFKHEQLHEQFAGRATIFPQLVARGNATLIIRRSGLKDRGTYRCHVHTSKSEHNAKVIVKVEAPIRGLSLELSRLSGYEEMKCSVRDVYPPPRVSWATEPPTFEDLRPVTRMRADKQGLYTVDSRLKRLNGQPNLIYICKATTSYGGPSWTASLREREIRGTEGRDLTIPCHAPPSLNKPFLRWSFTNGEDTSLILTYDSQSGNSVSLQPWDSHVELDGYAVPFGDGSLRLMDPKHLQHMGSYTCVFSMPYITHTERTEVTIDNYDVDRSTAEKPSYWWIVGLVVALLVVALAGMLACLKVKGVLSKNRKDPEVVTELHLVKDLSVVNESSPLTVGLSEEPTDSQPPRLALS